MNHTDLDDTDGLRLEQAASTFAALGSEQRLLVLRTLVRAGPAGLTIGALGERTGITGSTLTHHMKILTQAGLVGQEKQGRSIICAAVAYDELHDLAGPLGQLWRRIDKAWAASALILVVLALTDLPQLGPTLGFAARALANTAPIIAVAVLAIGYLKASGAETTIARAFEGNEVRMIVMAALLGGLSPFCSCEVIPFIAALLAVGTPLSAVMAFWLASPLMDPATFVVTSGALMALWRAAPLMDPAMFVVASGALGLPFALGKTLAAVGVGLLGGFVAMLAKGSPVFADPLREKPQVGGCCGVNQPFSGRPLWRFWNDPARRATFRDAVLENAVFLLKWLVLAYLIESLMLTYVPADWIAGVLGGDGVMPIVLGALVGAPAYLNGYAAVQLVDGLLQQGMAPGAAMSFVVAGGVTCIPAAVAVWALVKPRVFAAYVGLAMIGALLAGLAWSLAAPLIA
eukprot:g15827.t1